jgi:methylmalonyl-CoA mutase
MLDPAVKALKEAGCLVLLVAGRPGERERPLRDAGVSEFLFVGADVLRIMGEVLDSVGVQR